MSKLDWRDEFNKNNNSCKNQKPPLNQKNNKKPNPNCLIDPCNLYTIAVAITLLLYKELNVYQLNTVANLFGIIYYNLVGIARQVDLNIIDVDIDLEDPEL